MEAVRQLSLATRSSIRITKRISIPTRSFTAPTRQISVLSSGRNQLRNRIAYQQLSSKRWNSDTTVTVQQHDQTAGGKTDGSTSRLVASPSDESTTTAAEPEIEKRDVPSYEITFTCKPCSTRSTHKISKQGYHNGTILITCPDCKNRHLMCDHLNIFRDQKTTIEDILKEKGEMIKRGTVGAGGDIELWDDGTTSNREPAEPK